MLKFIINVIILVAWCSASLSVPDISDEISLNQVKILLKTQLKSANESQVRFELYTRKNQEDYKELRVNRDDLLWASEFNGKNKTVVIIHGFTETTINNSWMHAAKLGLFNKEPYNVILVDWEILARAPRYDLAAANTEFVGNLLAELLNYLSQKTGLENRNVYLIGFSLGAQVAGVAANNFRPSRITGLDPAQPLFGSADLSERLDADDADLVDVLHTNGGLLISGHLGFYEPVGDVDFYPNNGHDQTGCPNLILDSIANVIWNLDLSAIDACSHGRAPEYFVESLSSRDLVGYQCLSMEDLHAGNCLNASSNLAGYNTDPTLKGSFYFATLESSPFAVDHLNVVLHLGNLTRAAHGDLDLVARYSGTASWAEFTNGWDALTKDQELRSHFLVPAGSLENVSKTNVSLSITWDKNAAYMFGNADDLPVAAIEALSPSSNKRFCLGTDLVLPHKVPVELKSFRKGSCF